MNTHTLRVRAENAYYLYRERCGHVAEEAQKYIDWDNNVGCEYLPYDGLCILATIPDEYSNGGIPESVCPASTFFSFVKSREKITEQEFKSICI